jgi:hypothetical protein
MVVFTSLGQCLRLSSERPCTNAKTLPARGLPEARCPPSVFTIFQKNPDNCVETDRTSERFFGRKLDLVRSKGDGLHGVRRYCSFKVPSAYASAATARRLASTVRVLRSSSDLFSKVFG